MDEALGVFREMVSRGCDRNTVTYAALIAACERAGRPQAARELFAEMQREGVKPNVSTYNAVISACAQSECLTSAYIAAFPPMSPLSAFRVMYWSVTTITCRRRVRCIIHQLAMSSGIHSSRRAWSQDVARSNRCRRGSCCVGCTIGRCAATTMCPQVSQRQTRSLCTVAAVRPQGISPLN